MASRERVVLGDEYDRMLLAAAKEVLRELGARPKDSSWGLAGSQELSRCEFEVGRHQLVEAETYVGVTLEGDQALVEEIERRIRQLLGDASRH